MCAASRGRRVARRHRPRAEQRPARRRCRGLECHHHGTIAVDDTWRRTSPACGRSATSPTTTSSSMSPTPRPPWRSGTSPIPTTSATRATRRFPRAVFSNPQVATVGLTEQEAQRQGRSVPGRSARLPDTAYGWAMVDDTVIRQGAGRRRDRPDHRGARDRAAGVVDHPAARPGHAVRPAGRRGGADVFYIHPALTEVIENALLDALD